MAMLFNLTVDASNQQNKTKQKRKKKKNRRNIKKFTLTNKYDKLVNGEESPLQLQPVKRKHVKKDHFCFAGMTHYSKLIGVLRPVSQCGYLYQGERYSERRKCKLIGVLRPVSHYSYIGVRGEERDFMHLAKVAAMLWGSCDLHPLFLPKLKKKKIDKKVKRVCIFYVISVHFQQQWLPQEPHVQHRFPQLASQFLSFGFTCLQERYRFSLHSLRFTQWWVRNGSLLFG